MNDGVVTSGTAPRNARRGKAAYVVYPDKDGSRGERRLAARQAKRIARKEVTTDASKH